MTILYFLALIPLAWAADWGYEGDYGPSFWKKDYPDCGKPFQSPVDIVTTDTVNNEEFTHFIFENYDNDDGTVQLSNNGHTVGGVLPPNISMTGGGLEGRYYAAQFHFHWGSDDSIGSEHIVDGINYPAELHIVHHSANHPDVVDALDKSEGLAVLGIYLKLGEFNEAYDQIFKHLQNVTYKDEKFEIDHFPLKSLLPRDLTQFWRYSGSLTTPPCYESVVWTVFREPVELSFDQFAALRALRFNERGQVDKPMVDNDRPEQPLGNRTIYFCKTREGEVNYIFSSGDVDVEGDGGEEDIQWEYKGRFGPSNWEDYYPDCGRTSQSPINIVPKDTVYDESIPAFKFSGYDRTPKVDYTILNNGHTIGAVLPLTQNMTGGGLPNAYIADQFHFHWGEVDDKGSEHTIDTISYPLELHIVHHSNKYNDIGAAINRKEGLAVLGIFFTLGKYNPAFDKLAKYVNNVTYYGESSDFKPFRLVEILPSDTTSFYRYSGSLTTPPCFQSVIWTVFHQPVEISQAQLEAFRATKMSKRGATESVPMSLNYRPVQPIGRRTIYSSVFLPEFHTEKDTATLFKQSPLAVFFLSVTVLLFL